MNPAYNFKDQVALVIGAATGMASQRPRRSPKPVLAELARVTGTPF